MVLSERIRFWLRIKTVAVIFCICLKNTLASKNLLFIYFLCVRTLLQATTATTNLVSGAYLDGKGRGARGHVPPSPQGPR